MLNKVQVIGNLGKDPVIRHLESGTVVAKFSVAATEKFKNRKGELQETTEWFNCEAWGRQGEIIEKYLTKGSRVYVEGKQKTEKYEKDGVERRITKLVVFKLVMLSKKQESTGPVSNEHDVDTSQIPETDPDIIDDDLPF